MHTAGKQFVLKATAYLCPMDNVYIPLYNGLFSENRLQVTEVSYGDKKFVSIILSDAKVFSFQIAATLSKQFKTVVATYIV